MFSSVLVLLQLDSKNLIFINLCQVFSEKTPVMSVDICIRISVLINNKNSDKNNNNNNNNNNRNNNNMNNCEFYSNLKF